MRLPPSTVGKALYERQKDEAIRPPDQGVGPGGHGLRVEEGSVMRNLRAISTESQISDWSRVAGDAPVAQDVASISDYLALMKPRVMSLVVFTALVGLLVAPGHVHPLIGLTALICIAVGAGAAGALNMWYDADIDALMLRTARRPIPRGRVLPGEALAFGLTLAAGSTIVLGLLVNAAAAALLAFTIFFYVVIYTMWLKRTTPYNIVIGGAAGALPP